MKAVQVKMVWLVLSMLVISSAVARAQDDGGEPAPASATAKPAAKKPAKPRGRLPNYFSSVVSSKQRTEIYRIQSKYEAQIAELQKQLEALRAELSDEVDAVLDDDQLAIVNKKREDAAASRAARSSRRKSPDSE